MASGQTLIIFTPHSNEPPSSAYATYDTRNNMLVLDFDGATDEEAVFPGTLARHYASGGITVTIAYMMTSATSGSVGWQAAIERHADDSGDMDSDSFAAFQSISDACPNVSGEVGYAAIAFTDGAQMDSLAVGESFRLKIRRDADGSAVTDDQATDAELLRVEIRET